MPSFSLLFLVLTSVPPAKDAVPMPPPPPGMRVLNAQDTQSRVAVASVKAQEPEAEVPIQSAEEVLEDLRNEATDAADEEPTEESTELEEMRALEGATLDPGARPNAEVLQSLRRLGLANPLRQRMLDALEEPTFREDEELGEMPLITDLSSFDVSRVQPKYDIPVEMQPLVAQYIQFFQGPGRKWFRKWVSRSTRYLPVMQPILEAQGLPRDTVYLAMIESGFSPTAYSWAHASGPWQFISSTGRQYGLHQDFWVDERRDPIKATYAAARYLKDLHKELGHWYLAWAGYNTGSGRVRRLVERHGTDDFWVISAEKGLATETKHYVPKLIAAALIAKHPAAFGFSEDEFVYEQALAFDEVKITDATDLDVIARAAGVSVVDIQDLNPELRRWCTPPASAKNPYVLRLPQGTAPRFAENFARLAPKERLTFRIHKVKRGDTLSQIALNYGTAPEAILQMNQLKSVKTLRLNAELVIPVPAGRGAKADADSALARKVAQARRSGVTVMRPEDEVPAGTPRGPVATGPIKTESINGRKRITYGVQSGDSLWAIAQRFQVNVEDMRKWNNLTVRASKKALKVGSVLYVWPDSAPKQVVERAGTVIAQRAPASNAGRPGAVHELAAGESIWSVAQRYGVTVEDLKRWNNIKDTTRLPTGLRLVVKAP
ncbi:membrane-bound lytic murein transglycosylase D [Archangium gephyra]|uniref:Membrane-bound lytic murein transglycosylase D n=1 Tax=Archangium gephyra TaxID=48 RepID=A0AAC8QG57_9BACT|nr:LysM peptidoglycan-binding domain-containing protein [Archangium gephyra]AKJ06531.1 Membrane-bound lytic murein transglycosylase D precursor [Archangium gephyra]REG32155.1 membrane-bound lytic murein transglycosylase D [Archangium gephyra]